MANIELYKSLGRFVKQLHKVLSKGGKDALKDELSSKCAKKGNFFLEMESIQKLLRLWDNLLLQLDKVAVQLEKGDVKSIINTTKDLVNSVTALQVYIATAFVEIGSFVPGPVGIMCSLALAIGCFATGNISGGFLNLLGAIPFAKCAKLTTFDFTNITTIGDGAFRGCGFNTIVLPEATSIGGSAFVDNPNLISFSAPKATSFGWYPWGAESIETSKLETLELTAAGDFTIGNNFSAYTPFEEIDLVLNIVK